MLLYEFGIVSWGSAPIFFKKTSPKFDFLGLRANSLSFFGEFLSDELCLSFALSTKPELKAEARSFTDEVLECTSVKSLLKLFENFFLTSTDL